ncbi:pentatricopeptide repeat-containing protein at1g08070 [Phtheirospermum japonicum]|uniref:Pentatricopeptide repeat-containing protein at1g08070 n=1 Tax=Phtheirospermum japonicum TaxID=374723 RepID=A0A830BLY3_9LAMI|nr:pentatricopeptide repeat-containing protein at1g08070 [Phtheirospermum japonicum]
MPNPNVGLWTSLQNLYLNSKQPTKALMVFSELISSDSAKPDSHSIVAALSACARSKDLRNGTAIHGMVYKYLQEPRPNVHNALIDMYGKNQRVDLAELVFSNINFRDVAIWTSLLHGYILSGDMESANGVFDEMPHRNVVSWTAMIVGYVRKKNPIEALELFARMRLVDVIGGNWLIDMYGKSGNLDSSLKLFDNMRRKDLFSWTTMISGLALNGQGKQAILVFDAMVESGLSPNEVTFLSVLSACSHAGLVTDGERLFEKFVNSYRMRPWIEHFGCMVDLFIRAGLLEKAIRPFDNMRRKDLFSWTTMISGLALNGRGKQAILVFDAMVESGLSPNEVTFLSVLSACSHAGLVTDGERLFEKFVNSYRMRPWIEHFGCMVDLFIRAGRLEKAIRLIKEMPMKPDAAIRRSLLGACLGSGNLELAEIAGEKAVELEPDDDAVYVLLWGIYRSRNRWDDASRVMKMMRDRRIKKTPGCSWIEVDGVFHEFLAEALQHHVGDNISIVLDGIIAHLLIDTCFCFLEWT